MRFSKPRATELLTGPLATLSEPAATQIEYLRGRAVEDDLSDLDFVQELLEEFELALEAASRDLRRSRKASAALREVDEALRSPMLSGDVEAVRGSAPWERVRTSADRALRVLREEKLIPDAIAFPLIPVRLAPVVESVYGPTSEWPAIVLTQAEHDHFTQEWIEALPPSIPLDDITLDRVDQAVARVYARYPEIIDALRR